MQQHSFKENQTKNTDEYAFANALFDLQSSPMHVTCILRSMIRPTLITCLLQS